MTAVPDTDLYNTAVTTYYLARDASILAGGNPPPALFDFPAGTLAVGDGGGAVPTLSALLAKGGLINQVAAGQWITGVSVDPNNADQIDIAWTIPDEVNGVEIGPFWIREFAIYDELGNLCVVGTTQIEKTTSAQGQINTVTAVSAVVISSTANVVIAPPSTNFVT